MRCYMKICLDLEISTQRNMLSMIYRENKISLDEKLFSCGIFIDLQKTFDTVNHKFLSEKLKIIGIELS